MMNQTTPNTITNIKTVAMYPAVTLTGCRPTVLGITYSTWAEALAAKWAAVTYYQVDLYGAPIGRPENIAIGQAA